MNGLRMLWLAIAGGALGAFAGIGLPGLDAGIAAAVGAAVGGALGAASSAIVLRRRAKRPEPTAAASAAALRLREERLDIRKERVVTGDVAIRREVVEEKRTIEVPVRREEVVIERTSVPSGDPDGAATETIRIPVKEERIDIVKTPVDLEDVSVYTRPVEELREAKATVRREELRVERIGQTGESPESSEEQHP